MGAAHPRPGRHDLRGPCAIATGITQLTFNTDSDDAARTARTLGREFVVQVTGKVVERQSKNANMHTGEVERFSARN